VVRSPALELHQLPQLWLSRVMADIGTEQSHLCATRRSAGIPFYIQVAQSEFPCRWSLGWRMHSYCSWFVVDFHIPSPKTQQKTVKYLDQLSEKTEKLKSVQKEKMERLKALKASLLDRAFRGEL